MDSFRLHLIRAYTKSLCHLWQILTAHQTFPNLLCISFSTCRHPYPGEPLRCICLLLHKAYQPSPNMQRLDTRYSAHTIFHPAMREGQHLSRGCNVRFILRPVELFAPPRWPPLLSRGSGYFYIRAFPYSVTLLRVEYSYLGEQTIPRTGLAPAGNTALWAARIYQMIISGL